jgi:hypothetical protein
MPNTLWVPGKTPKFTQKEESMKEIIYSSIYSNQPEAVGPSISCGDIVMPGGM